jgi:predicted Ser/Thr protein kinase
MQDLCNTHRWYRRKQSLVGSGTQSYIYQACKQQQKLNPKCQYVVKELEPIYNTKYDELAANLGIGPNIFMEKCNDKIYLIQERLDGTLLNLLNSKETLNEKELNDLSNLIYDSIDMMNIFHNDLHAENVMYKIIGQDKKFYLIDFSTAQPIDSTGFKQFDKKLAQHSFIRINDKFIMVLFPTQIEELKSKHRPYLQETQQQIQKEKQRIRKINTAKQIAAKQLELRMKKFKK